MLPVRRDPEPNRTLSDVAKGGHVRYGSEWPTPAHHELDELDPVSVRADWDARNRLLFEAVASLAWSLSDAWEG